ncbi:MAG: alpha/beta fold hydrolase [Sterolibacterium sp.]|nr:alpha/beta fold hydrolase [Sterolibacterium sp.]
MLVKLAGWTPTRVLMLIILLALAWRTWAILFTYVIAFLSRSPLPAEYRIGVFRQLLEALHEVGAFGVLLVIELLDPIFLKPDAQSKPSDGQMPLLLIHGYCCNRSFWWWLKPRLEARGRCVATLTLEPLYGSIDGYSELVARRVNALCRDTGAQQVILVGHSMGGLVGRAYLRRYGEMRVARLITLGTPHQGSVMAGLGLGRNAREMEQGSSWLRDLAKSPVPVPCFAIYSLHDNFIRPQISAMLSGAENHALAGIGHLAMSVSPAVLEALLSATSS